VQGVTIGVAVNRHRFYPKLLAGTDDAERNFAAIGDQDLIKHFYFRGRMAKSGWPYSTGWPLVASRFTTSPQTSDSISFISFMASIMHSTWPACTTSPGFTKGGVLGRGAS